MIETNIGVRVKALREASRMSQETLAGILKFENRQSVSDIERGLRKLSADELVEIVDTFHVSFEALTNPFLLSAKDSFSWRQREVPLAELDAFESRAGEWIGAFGELRRLNEDRLKKILPRLGLTHMSSFEEAVEAGEDVANELSLGDRPALQLAETLQDRLGILVLMVDAPEQISGAACRLRELNAILINRHERQGRRNSDLAHELFHLLTWEQMKPQRLEAVVEEWDRVASRSQQRNQRIEQLADNFANGLLMPSWELDRIGAPHGNPVQWLCAAAQELGVSARGLKWRLVNSRRNPELANVSNEALYELQRNGDEAEHPLPFSKAFIATVVKAIEGGHISAGRAAKLCDLTREGLGQVAEHYRLEVPIELT